MTTALTFQPHDASMWLRQEAARILRALNTARIPRDGRTIVIVPLVDCDPGTDEDFTCDRCRLDTRPGVIHAGVYEALPDLRITFGLCTDCMTRELPRWTPPSATRREPQP